MAIISDISALEILDSRGNPTVSVTVALSSGARGTAKIPSGASTGSREAVELRDGDKKRYHGKGVLQACANVEGEILSKLRGLEASNQSLVDSTLIELDGRQTQLAPKTKGNIKSLMFRLMERAMYWELVPLTRNPIGLVEIRGVSKRRKTPFILTVKQYHQVVEQLVKPYKQMVQVAMCLGLRVSEVLALKWSDFDFDGLTLQVVRGVVHGRISDVKTEYSEDDLPLDSAFAELMMDWRSRCPKNLFKN